MEVLAHGRAGVPRPQDFRAHGGEDTARSFADPARGSPEIVARATRTVIHARIPDLPNAHSLVRFMSCAIVHRKLASSRADRPAGRRALQTIRSYRPRRSAP